MQVYSFLSYIRDSDSNIIAYRFLDSDRNEIEIHVDKFLELYKNNEIFIKNKELGPNNSLIKLGSYDYSDKNLDKYKRTCEEYQREFPSDTLEDLVNSYKLKEELIGLLDYSIDFEILNDKIFITNLPF